MTTLLVILLAVLVVVVAIANSRRKKGALTEATYSTLVNALSIFVTVVALVVLFLRLRS